MKNILSGITAGLFFVATTSFAQTPNQSIAPPSTDSEIVAVLHAANTNEIKAGKMAKSKSSNQKIAEFAQKMIVDHTKANELLEALAKEQNIEKQESDMSKKIKSDGAEALRKLKGLREENFEKAYLALQVSDHQMVLHMINSTLIPIAGNAQLKDFLTELSPIIEGHLFRANGLQASMP